MAAFEHDKIARYETIVGINDFVEVQRINIAPNFSEVYISPSGETIISDRDELPFEVLSGETPLILHIDLPDKGSNGRAIGYYAPEAWASQEAFVVFLGEPIDNDPLFVIVNTTTQEIQEVDVCSEVDPEMAPLLISPTGSLIGYVIRPKIDGESIPKVVLQDLRSGECSEVFSGGSGTFITALQISPNENSLYIFESESLSYTNSYRRLFHVDILRGEVSYLLVGTIHRTGYFMDPKLIWAPDERHLLLGSCLIYDTVSGAVYELGLDVDDISAVGWLLEK